MSDNTLNPMESKKLLTKEYKKDILGNRYRVQVDDESKNHESHCYTFTVSFARRTIFTCNCSQRENYEANFYNLRRSQ